MLINESKKNACWRALIGVALGIMGISCTADRGPDEGGTLPLASPPELHGAQLLFHRPNGLYLMTVGKNEVRQIHPQGIHGRWAPGGGSFAFLAGNELLWHDLESKSTQKLTDICSPRAIAFHPDGQQLLFTDGGEVRSVTLETREVSPVLSGPEFFELDIASSGRFLTATVRRRGYRVMRYELPSGDSTDFGRGCSASVSADDRWITVNSDDHLRLVLHNLVSREAEVTLRAPSSHPLDNQKWSNHPQWLAGIVEQPTQDIMIQRVPDGQIWRVTNVGDADRPDLFIPLPSDP